MASTSDQQLENKRLLARLDDALDIANRRDTPHFVGFLDERQTALARFYLAKCQASCSFFGGHEEAERTMVGVYPYGVDAQQSLFPIAAVAFVYGMAASLSHRDVLGSLLGCGVAREKIGDILCASDRAVVFVHESIADFLAQTVTKIGRVGVKTVIPYEGELPVFHRYEDITGTVASPRLDAVLKVLLNVSREQAADRIKEALVQVDHQPVLSVSHPVCGGQILSVRGSGRFVIDDVSKITKKGRLILQARKYV